MDGPGRWQVLRLHVEDEIPLAALARETGIGLRTLQRWHQRYKAGGVAGLAPRPRSDDGVRRTPAALVTFIEHLALTRPRPPISVLHRHTLDQARRLGLPAPSYATVREIVAALDPALVTLALEGPAAYRDRFELVLRFRAERPNQSWQADHTELDILTAADDGSAQRPWLTVVMDDYSRAICGYMLFTGAPSAINTALALRQAIWRKDDPAWAMCGLPDRLHVDHGSDFTSGHLDVAAITLKIRIIYSTIARPQGRGKIERFFGTLNTEVLAALPGAILPGAAKPKPSLSLGELDQTIRAFIATYNERVHSELGVCPREAWIGNGWLPRMPEALAELDGLLLTVPKHRTVQRDGIHFQGQRYLCPTLAPMVGLPVTIRYDPRDVSEIRVYDHDTFICVAIDEAHPNQRLSLRDIESARSARRRQLRRQIAERIPTAASPRDEPDAAPTPSPPSPPPRRRRRLRVYEEDD